MFSRPIFPALVFVFLSVLASCGGSKTPDEQLTEADAAKRARDFGSALELYEGLLAWNGEGDVGARQRFQASLESVKCLIALDREEDGVERFKAMYVDFGDDMNDPKAYKHTLAVISTLIQEKADPGVSIDLLEVAKEKHPEQQDQFGKLVEKLLNQDVSDEQMARLKTLGYL